MVKRESIQIMIEGVVEMNFQESRRIIIIVIKWIVKMICRMYKKELKRMI